MAHILLVDDEADVLEILTSLMTTSGHDPVALQRGDVAIERLRVESFDLMVADLRMAPVDGIALITAAGEIRPDMQTIILTAHASDMTRKQAAELGVYAYLTKPFRMSELLDTVDRALEEVEAGDEDEE